MEPRVALNKNSQQRRQRTTKILIVVLILIIVLIGVIIGFLRKKTFQIVNVSVVGTQALDPAVIQKVGANFLVGNYIWVIPRTNELLLSRAAMRAYVLNHVPGLDDASISIVKKTSVVITVIEKKPKYVWCAVSCFFVDQNGLVYDPAPTFSDGVFMTFVGQSLNGTIANVINPAKLRFVSMTEFSNDLAVIKSIQNYPARVLGIQLFGQVSASDPTYPDITTGQHDIAVRVGSIGTTVVNSNAVIMITDSESPDSITQSLGLLSNDQSFTNMLASNAQNLEYVDLRFAGKIYYKFKTQSAPAVPTVKKSKK